MQRPNDRIPAPGLLDYVSRVDDLLVINNKLFEQMLAVLKAPPSDAVARGKAAYKWGDAVAYNKARAGEARTTYTVTAGKTLYVTDLFSSIIADLAADSDLNQYGTLEMTLNDVRQFITGLNGGIAVSLETPIPINSGITLAMYTTNYTNHACGLSVSWRGYEV